MAVLRALGAKDQPPLFTHLLQAVFHFQKPVDTARHPAPQIDTVGNSR